MARALDVWMNGERVGTWDSTRAGNHVLRYDPAWLDSPRARPLSLSLPFLPDNQTHRGKLVESWFDNLLPDTDSIRERIRKRFQTGSTSTFDLLAAIGRDCVGAVQLVPEGENPGDVRRIDAEPIDDQSVAKLLRSTTATPLLGQHDDAEEFRISIAGAQEKTALLRLNGRWYRPNGATPTTHILKLPLGLVGGMRADMKESVENEWLCMQLLREMGLPVANTEIATFEDESGEERVLVVERFDRQWMPAESPDGSGWILRLPQEDFCQATGTPSDRKYESDKGPGIPMILNLLAASEDPAGNSMAFAKAQLAFWLMAATDGHAKNFSIFLRREGEYTLTPLYDVLSAWPIIGHGPNKLAYQEAKLAMAIRGSRPYRHLKSIAARHWRRLAAATGVDDAFEQMVAMVEAVEQVLDTVSRSLPPRFPENVWIETREGMLKHREKFLNGLKALEQPSAANTLDAMT